MLQKFFCFITIPIFFVIESTLFSHLSIAGVTPDILIIPVSVFGFMYGEKTGMYTGFLAGLLFDIFFGGMLGFSALIMTLVGYVNGQFFGLFYPEDIRLPMILIFTSDLSYGLLFYIFRFLVRGKLNFSFYLLKIIVPEALYTLLISIIVYPVLLHAYNRFEMIRLRKERTIAGHNQGTPSEYHIE